MSTTLQIATLSLSVGLIRLGAAILDTVMRAARVPTGASGATGSRAAR